MCTTVNTGEDVGGKKLLYTVTGNATTMKSIWWFLKKLKIELPYDPVISLLDIYPKNVSQETIDILAHLCLLQHYSQNSRFGKIFGISPTTDVCIKKMCSIYTQWSII
jgi:hypothetical protein